MENRQPKLYFTDYLFKYTLVPLTPSWLKPNHLTLLRFLLTPFIIWLMLTEKYQIGTGFFIFAALTDAWDGSLARIRNQVTVWGQTYDPLADKLLVGSVFLIVAWRYWPLLTVLTVGLDLSFVFAGWYWQRHGWEIKANIWGKIKMTLQVLGLVVLLLAVQTGGLWLLNLAGIIFWSSLFFALVSLITHGIWLIFCL